MGPFGAGTGAIQIEAIAAYFAVIGLEDLELREAWLVMIQRMDQAWLDHQDRLSAERDAREKREAELKKARA
jgi:hypothetical protein